MGLLYNTVAFPHNCTETHESGPDKDPTGVDTLYTRTTIGVRGLLYPGDYPAVSGETPAQTADRITHLLTTPRRSLQYSVGTTVMLSVFGGDDANGPEPDASAFKISQITEAAFEVHFSVTVRLRRCTAGDARGYLSVKWSDAEAYAGKDWTCVRRRTGLLITSRRLRSPDDLRGVITPGVPAGFRRESAEYELSEDGLRLKFAFTDKQLHKGLPWPCTKISGHQAETIPKNGGMRRGELALRLNAPPGTDGRELLQVAIRIGLARMYASNPQAVESGTRKSILVGVGVKESLNDDETAVELALDWQISPPNTRGPGVEGVLRSTGQAIAAGTAGAGAIGLAVWGAQKLSGGGRIENDQKTPEGRPAAAAPELAGWLGVPFAGADKNAGVGPPTRGWDRAAYLKLVAAALHDPCGSVAILNPSPGADNVMVGTDGYGTATLRSGPVATAPESPTVYAKDAGIWEHWTMTYTFWEDTGYGVVPATAPNTAGAMIRFGNRRRKLFVKWSLAKTGDSPVFPRYEVPRPGGYTSDGRHDPNWVGRTATTTYESVDVAADGASYHYAAAGETEWEAIDPSQMAEGYPVPPWLVPANRPAPASLTAGTPAPAAGQLPAPAAVLDLSIRGVPPPNP